MGAIVALPTAINSFPAKDSDINSCDVAPSETAGPFPIHSPADLVRANIISDRGGVALLVTLTVVNQNCDPVSGVYVDIWHCDSQGDYSEYGGTQMQTTDYTDKHFLRGRQTTDSNGQVSFISIYPGWYKGRAPHIHVEILDTTENSIKITQIAFPKDVCDTVYATDGYKGTADTLNENDNVFSDSLDGNMADSATGNTTDGYTLTKVIGVNYSVTGINDEQTLPEGFELKQNYPNPFNPTTTIQYSIPSDAFVRLTIFNTLGKEVAALVNTNKAAGTYEVQFNAKNLSSGTYFYRIIAGNYSQTKQMLLLK